MNGVSGAAPGRRRHFDVYLADLAGETGKRGSRTAALIALSRTARASGSRLRVCPMQPRSSPCRCNVTNAPCGSPARASAVGVQHRCGVPHSRRPPGCRARSAAAAVPRRESGRGTPVQSFSARFRLMLVRVIGASPVVAAGGARRPAPAPRFPAARSISGRPFGEVEIHGRVAHAPALVVVEAPGHVVPEQYAIRVVRQHLEQHAEGVQAADRDPPDLRWKVSNSS